MLLNPGRHALDDLLWCLGLILFVALIEGHGATDVLESSKLWVLCHNSGLLCLQDLIISFKRLYALFHRTIGELRTAKIASNLLLLLIPAKFILNPHFLTSFLIKFCDSSLLLRLSLNFQCSDLLDFCLVPFQGDFEFFKLLFISFLLIFDHSDLVIEPFLAFLLLLLLEHLFTRVCIALVLHLDFLRFVLQHSLTEPINGFAQICDHLILFSSFLLQTKELLVCSLDVDPLSFTSQIILQ